jgi:HEAT repeat protein
LSDEAFQADLAEWLMAGDIKEGDAAKARLMRWMEIALTSTSASAEQVAFVKSGYFDAVDKAVFAHPILAHWRHQLSLDYLREQVAVLRRQAEEAAGVYSPERQKAALDCYCGKALAAWDIIDLSNLPEGDIQMATQKLLLRALYMPLRVEIEHSKLGEDHDGVLARLEEQRESRRHCEAGHRFTAETDRLSRAKSCAPIGECLATYRRLVVLGDPGGGKTTMLRWMATAYLLRHKADDAFRQIPDVDTLPSQPWIPVLIRCRDIGEADLCRCFTDFLTQYLNKTELLPEEAEVMRAVILRRIAKGEVLLLVDGLDEIANPHVRMMFCQEMERTAARYPVAPIIVTSRIVGYRDMPYRIGPMFEHGVIAELAREDKDRFARCWVEVTEQHLPPAEQTRRTLELQEALHSSDRIERLTGTPMLLTTLILVKRKIGKLPSRRNKLYAEAVSVLLNWNPRVYQPVDEEEVIPQLEYLAYEMNRRVTKRLSGDQIYGLLENVRTEYPHVRAIRRREPREFLGLLEARSSIFIRSGGIWQENRHEEKAAWEFRHLSFQEYLAARALLDGRFPGRDRTKSLSQEVALLAGAVEETKVHLQLRGREVEVEVPESWRETLRLLVADCNDDDVDDVLLTILNPLASEDPTKTARPRAVLAGLCLADEPNIREETARRVLTAFAAVVEKYDCGTLFEGTTVDSAANEIARSMWSTQLKRALIQEFCQRTSAARVSVGNVLGKVELACWRSSGIPSRTFFTGLVQRLRSGERAEMISAALAVMTAAWDGVLEVVEDLPGSLLDLLAPGDAPVSHSAAVALGALYQRQSSSCTPGSASSPLVNSVEVPRLINAFEAVAASEPFARQWLALVLGYSRDSRVLHPLLRRLDDPDEHVRRFVVMGLTWLNDKRAVPSLLAMLDDPNTDVRQTVLESLGYFGDKRAVPTLLEIMDEADAEVQMMAIEALGRLGDDLAVPTLLEKMDKSDAAIQKVIIEALGRLGDDLAVPKLLTKLNDPDAGVRLKVILALERMGSPQAKEPLTLLLEDCDHQVCAAAAAALTVLGAGRGSTALSEFLTHSSTERRKAAIRELVRIRARPEEEILLSLYLHGTDPWMDPFTPITQSRIARAAQVLRIPAQEAHSLYQSIADDFHLRFS